MKRWKIIIMVGILCFTFSSIIQSKPEETQKEEEKVKKLIDLSKSVQGDVIKWRRELHMYPEIRWEEEETVKRIYNWVSEMSPPYMTYLGINKGGLRVDFTFDSSFNWILFRADIDALPIQEKTELPYASKTPGKMHACGHDAHAAMLLGFIKILATRVVTPKHNLTLVFERAEENPGADPIPESGAQAFIAEGILEKINYVYALHVKSNLKPGFYSRPDSILGNSDRLRIRIFTKGGHVMAPDKGISANKVRRAIENRLDGFMEKFLPGAHAVLVEASCEFGEGRKTSNILPAEGEMWWAFRTYLGPDDRHRLFSQLKSEVREAIKGFDETRVEVYLFPGHPVTVNDRGEFYRIKKIFESAGQKVETFEKRLGGESFAHYLKEKPGLYCFLGAGDSTYPPHHTPEFLIDESVLWQGVLYWLLLATN